jgi:hypothetical protein
MFILDSLMISGLRWVMNTVVTAAEAEMNDDTALREQLLEAEMRREMGEISDEEFAELEADVLERIREIKERRDGGSGAIGLAGQPMSTVDRQFQVEATVSGDFHEPSRDTSVTSSEVIEPATPGDVFHRPRASRTRTARPSRARTRRRRKS